MQTLEEEKSQIKKLKVEPQNSSDEEEEEEESSIHHHNHQNHEEKGLKVEFYKHCRKNHAANIGKYAVDGCCEFMPGGEAGSDSALLCAACGCHRNFHDKVVVLQYSSSHHHNHNQKKKYYSDDCSSLSTTNTPI